MSTRRIAMWSGPRNISTALMRSFENRADTVVCDEPLYGYYLNETGIDHPMAGDIIADMECDWRSVTAALSGPVAGGAAYSYQKHMTHHLLDGMARDWMDDLVNCFLIRNPAEVIASYAAKRDHITLDDIGMVQQNEIYSYLHTRTGRRPVVIDARDVLINPQAMLHALCDAIAIPFDEAMLHWPTGRRDSDGVWAAHWYHNVEASSGFAPYTPQEIDLNPDHAALAEACEPHYQELYRHRLQAKSL
mgnify:CR=1 FL=1